MAPIRKIISFHALFQMQYYVLTCYLFIIFVIVEYASILILQDEAQPRDVCHKLIDNIFGSIICFAFIVCNVMYIYFMYSC